MSAIAASVSSRPLDVSSRASPSRLQPLQSMPRLLVVLFPLFARRRPRWRQAWRKREHMGSMARMDTLESMKVFARVAQRPGFAAAARDLRMSPAAVTKHVAALETRVGARLFDRTTRKVGPLEGQYVARPLARLHVGVFASPAYLSRGAVFFPRAGNALPEASRESQPISHGVVS